MTDRQWGGVPRRTINFYEGKCQSPRSGHVYDSPFDKMNRVDIVKYAIQVQYDVGNMAGYMDYKKFWDFLTQ